MITRLPTEVFVLNGLARFPFGLDHIVALLGEVFDKHLLWVVSVNVYADCMCMAEEVIGDVQ